MQTPNIKFLCYMYTAGIIITGSLLALYCLLILQYRKWFLELPLFKPGSPLQSSVRFSVIIPARNEEGNIGACLQTVLQQQYDATQFEVIVVNDHSTDGTARIVCNLQQHYPNLKLINLEDYLQGNTLNAYKKKAIETAITESTGNWIVTTDADCCVPVNWLSLLNAYIQQHDPVFVAAPVMFTHKGGFLSLFQLLDFISLQGITAAAVSAGYHTMCNGANLAYRKDVFYEVGQFRGIDRLASGDDMLLMYKIKQLYPQRTGYLFSPDAIVTTAPMPNWKQFLHQRIRWASKADSYKDKSVFRILAMVYAVNACLLLLLPVNLFVSGNITHWLLLVLIKTVVELGFMIPVSRFYGRHSHLWWFPLMQPFHILYTVIAGWLGKFGSYQWKGRAVQ